MKRSVIVLGIAAAACLNSGNVTAAGPDPRGVSIQSVHYRGSACPGDSVDAWMSRDAATITVTYDSYVASVGPGIPETEARKYCKVQIEVRHPEGWMFTIGAFDTMGYVRLPDGMTGTQKTVFSFDWSDEAGASRSSFEGPIGEDYVTHETPSFTTLVPLKCDSTGGLLTVDTQARINPGNAREGQGEMTTGSADGKVMHILGLEWIQC